MVLWFRFFFGDAHCKHCQEEAEGLTEVADVCRPLYSDSTYSYCILLLTAYLLIVP